MIEDGILTFEDFKIPGFRVFPHLAISRLDELALWFEAEDALFKKGVAEPVNGGPNDGRLVFLKPTGETEEIGRHGKLYTPEKMAEKRKTTLWKLE